MKFSHSSSARPPPICSRTGSGNGKWILVKGHRARGLRHFCGRDAQLLLHLTPVECVGQRSNSTQCYFHAGGIFKMTLCAKHKTKMIPTLHALRLAGECTRQVKVNDQVHQHRHFASQRPAQPTAVWGSGFLAKGHRARGLRHVFGRYAQLLLHLRPVDCVGQR